ncbi:MAG: class I SAM-dependent methyltransferase [Nitrospirae bacterium]|nr:MAG: class I SAM-dependent methyltransferase [Nitrospirota bacterium]
MADPSLIQVRCPLCDEGGSRPKFTKDGFSIVECPVCRLLYVNPRPPRTWLDAWYRHEYFSFSQEDTAGMQHVQHGAIKTATARSRLQLFDAPLSNGRLVDIGCGGGFFVRAATAGGWDAVGLEPSVKAARCAAQTQRIRVIAGRLEEAPFAAGRFDVITMFDVLEHVATPRTVLAEARRLLAPGGRLVIETPNMAGWMPRLMGKRHPWVRPPEHLTYFTPLTLRRLLDQGGFRVEQLHRSTKKVLTLDYVLALTARTNPFATALLKSTLGRWKTLGAYLFSVPLATMLAIARPIPQEKSA